MCDGTVGMGSGRRKRGSDLSVEELLQKEKLSPAVWVSLDPLKRWRKPLQSKSAGHWRRKSKITLNGNIPRPPPCSPLLCELMMNNQSPIALEELLAGTHHGDFCRRRGGIHYCIRWITFCLMGNMMVDWIREGEGGEVRWLAEEFHSICRVQLLQFAPTPILVTGISIPLG